MLFGDKEIISKNFWKSYVYSLIFALPMTLLLSDLSGANSAFEICVRLSTVVFLVVLVAFNLVHINADAETFRKNCDSETISKYFALLIVILLVVSLLIKSLK